MNQLILDTISYLKQERFLVVKKTAEPALNISLPQKPKVAMQKKEAPPFKEQPIETKHEPILPLFGPIQKHLPHIRLIQKIPKPQIVAIIVSDPKQLPFFEKLAQAIQDRFCKTTLFTKETEIDLSSYSLILTQENTQEIDPKKQIPIAKAQYYQDHPEEKKHLWLQLCQLLKSF